MSTSTVQNKESADRHAVYYAPECPDCHDICHPTATVCEGCGSHLFPAKPTQRSAA